MSIIQKMSDNKISHYRKDEMQVNKIRITRQISNSNKIYYNSSVTTNNNSNNHNNNNKPTNQPLSPMPPTSTPFHTPFPTIHLHTTKITRILTTLCQHHPDLSQQIDLALYSCLKIEKIIKKHQQLQDKIDKANRVHQQQNGDSNVLVLNEEEQLYQNALSVIGGFRAATKRLEGKVGILLREQELKRQVERARYHNDRGNGIDDVHNAYYEEEEQEEEKPYPHHHQYSRKQTISRNNATTKSKPQQQRKHVSTYQPTSPFSPHIAQYPTPHKKPSSSFSNKHYISSSSKQKPSYQQMHRKHVQQYIMNESESFDQIPERSNGNESKNMSELDQEIIELASQIKHAIKKKGG